MHWRWLVALAVMAAADGHLLADDIASRLPPIPRVYPQMDLDLVRPWTALEMYKTGIRLSISDEWHQLMNARAPATPTGKVHIRFMVHSDGTVTNVRRLDGDPGLAAVAIDSIQRSGPFHPFSGELVDQVGEHFTYDLPFINERGQ
jgi:hypothetical protein